MDWGKFLARPMATPPAAYLLDALRSTPILVVGAGGSIGSALALRLAALAPPALVLLEASESKLYALQRECAEAGLAEHAVFVLGSVSDAALLEEIFALHGPGLVFHAAAFKHVPLLEGQPFAAIGNNVFGTRSLVAAATGARVILLSTDKAAGPISIMGATKRVAEQIVADAGGTALRLGNVLASQDSVAEVFARQIAAGGPLTVTDPEARRYFLTIDEAVNLLLLAAVEPGNPSILAPALPAPQLVTDLAYFMRQELAPGGTITVTFTGSRPGDKVTEQFWSAGERAGPATSDTMLRIESPYLASSRLRSGLAELRAALDSRELAATVMHLCCLAPDYVPSPALLALTGESKPGVAI